MSVGCWKSYGGGSPFYRDFVGCFGVKCELRQLFLRIFKMEIVGLYRGFISSLLIH